MRSLFLLSDQTGWVTGTVSDIDECDDGPGLEEDAPACDRDRSKPPVEGDGTGRHSAASCETKRPRAAASALAARRRLGLGHAPPQGRCDH